MSPPLTCPSNPDETYDLRLLERSHAKWKRSPALRAYYESVYRQMAAFAAPGPALEVGSGCGFICDFIPEVVTTDVCATRFVPRAASAYALEAVAGGPWSTIYLLDVLHHLREPMRFFDSAARALRSGGRIVLMEPAATALGRVFYRMFHHEPIEPAGVGQPYIFGSSESSPEFANMGIGWAMFGRDREHVQQMLSRRGLALLTVRFRDLVSYPVTGGFSGPALLPATCVRALGGIEARLPSWLLAKTALRMLIVVERP